jgi:hypothetical protein
MPQVPTLQYFAIQSHALVLVDNCIIPSSLH